MKKFLVVLLALACALTMFACGDEETVDLSAFNNAATSSKPASATLEVSLDSTLGSLAAKYDIAYAADGSATVNYTREQFNAAGSSNDEVKSEVSGTVNCDASGKLADAAAFGVDTIPGTNFNFDATKMSVTVNGNVLSATVSADNTEAVLGANYGADVTLVYTINDGKVASFSMAYTTTVGAISISCAYTY